MSVYSKTSGTSNLRAIAANILLEVENGHSLSAALPAQTAYLSSADKGLIQEICFGVCRQYFRLDRFQKQLLERPISRKFPLAPLLIKIGFYQIAHMRIPDHAAINETVAAAEALRMGNLKGMINAVLRNFQRRLEEYRQEESQLKGSNALNIKSSHWNHPEWMVEKLKHNWPDKWSEILLENDEHPPMTLRVNKAKISTADYLKQLQALDISAQLTEWSDVGITLASATDVTQLPGFDKGWVSVQDEAAQLCSGLLIDSASSEPLKVLDACAAPGGKTLAMLEAHPNLSITVLDADEHRLTRVTENLERAHFPPESLTTEIIQADASEPNDWWDGELYDRILLDAPCSATGVIRRHPDIKLLRKESDIPKLATLQLKILTALWKTLKPGGTLLYATCSVFPQENTRIIERFLPDHQDASVIPIDVEWGESTAVGRQFFPAQQKQDGFFYALLRKLACSS